MVIINETSVQAVAYEFKLINTNLAVTKIPITKNTYYCTRKEV